MGIDVEDDRLTLLWSNMRESAADWAGSIARGGVTYKSFKCALLEHFRSEMVSKVRQLEELQ